MGKLTRIVRHGGWGAIGIAIVVSLIAAAGSSGSGLTRAGEGRARAATIYNHCIVKLYNAEPKMKVLKADKYGHDDWDPYPRTPFGNGWLNSYGTESGFARGCWNRVEWGDGTGTAEVYVSDPYRGSNEYHCKTTGALTCAGPLNVGKEPFQKSILDGDHLRVYYLICTKGRRHCIGANPPWKCTEGHSCGY